MGILCLVPASRGSQEIYSEALAQFKSSQYEVAIQTVDRAEPESPQKIPLLELKGRILAALGKHEEALMEFQKVVALDDKRASAHFHVGEVFFSQKKWPEAFGAFRYALDMDSQYRTPILKMIYCLIIMENYPAAHQWISTLDPTDDMSPDYYFGRAAMELATGSMQEHNDLLRQARTIYSTEVFNRFEPDLLRVAKVLKERPGTAASAPASP